MSTPINDGGPAFPFAAEYGHPAACGGMTLRDWFAGQALTGFLASLEEHESAQFGEPSHAAKTAFQYADAMIAAREAKP